MEETSWFDESESEVNAYLADITSKPHLEKMNVEGCCKLAVGSFGRGLLRPQGTSVSEPGSLGKSGIALARSKWGMLKVEFEVIRDVLDDPRLLLMYDYKGRKIEQEILLDLVPTPYGQRPYMRCSCGRRGHLYLRPDYQWFGCRSKRCLNLGYEVSRFDKRWSWGVIGYFMNRSMKLEMLALRLKRNKYRGGPTNKALALQNLARKWQPYGEKAAGALERIG